MTAAKDTTDCKEGGTKFTVGGKSEHVCNGSPWTAGGTLPKGSTETGAFVINGKEEAIEGLGGLVALPVLISFSIPLEASLAAGSVHFIGVGEGAGEGSPNPAIVAKECLGTVEAPGAASGNLCIFVATVHNVEVGASLAATPGGAGGTGTVGSVVLFKAEVEAKPMFGLGAWAVTG